jgi:hypothetical protein
LFLLDLAPAPPAQDTRSVTRLSGRYPHRERMTKKYGNADAPGAGCRINHKIGP